MFNSLIGVMQGLNNEKGVSLSSAIGDGGKHQGGLRTGPVKVSLAFAQAWANFQTAQDTKENINHTTGTTFLKVCTQSSLAAILYFVDCLCLSYVIPHPHVFLLVSFLLLCHFGFSLFIVCCILQHRHMRMRMVMMKHLTCFKEKQPLSKFLIL